MPIRIKEISLKTALCVSHHLDQTEELKSVAKCVWARDVLRTLGFRLEVQGIPPDRDTQVLVGDHLSYLDLLVLIAVSPSDMFISNNDFLRWPIIGASAKAARTNFISRKPGTDRSDPRDQIVKPLKKTTDAKSVALPFGMPTLNESHEREQGIFGVATNSKSWFISFEFNTCPCGSPPLFTPTTSGFRWPGY